MTKQELETWLCDDAPVPSPEEIAEIIGTPFDDVGDTTLLRVADRLLAVRFTIAVLRDVFEDDQGVRLWLRAPRPELGELSALDLLLAGETGPVEELAVREWNGAASALPDDSPARDYRQSVGRSSASRDATSASWPPDPTFFTVSAV